MTKSNRKTHGYYVAIETWFDDLPDSKSLQTMLETLLSDHGYDVNVNIESMGEIDCYEGLEDEK